METLFVGHRRRHYQCCNRNRGGYSSMKFGSFGSPPSSNFGGIIHPTFQSGEGLLPTPSKALTTKMPVTEKAFPLSSSPDSPSLSLNISEKASKVIAKSRETTIPIKFEIDCSERDFDFSERWAGPAYSNSPPPSSLPIPKFYMNPQRTVSLDLPNAASKINFYHIAKSAPASPTRERSPSPIGPFDFSDSGTETSLSPCDVFDLSDSGTEMSPLPYYPVDISVSATLTLRRILNLDDTDK